MTMKIENASRIQVTLKVSLNLTSQGSRKEFAFSLDSLTINDPCYNEKLNELYSCNKQGTCIRHTDEMYSRKCNCYPGYTGDDCEMIDYCNMDDGSGKNITNQEHYCASKCMNNLGTFECECDADSRWDYVNKR